MLRLLFYILSFCFLLQCSGTSGFLKQPPVKIEQGADDNSGNEGQGKAAFKTDKYNSFFSPVSGFCNDQVIDYYIASRLFCPSGYLNTPFLPPRQQ